MGRSVDTSLGIEFYEILGGGFMLTLTEKMVGQFDPLIHVLNCSFSPEVLPRSRAQHLVKEQI